MYEGAAVSRDDYGHGKVISDVKCSGPNGDTYLLQIEFDDITEVVSMYADEVNIMHNT